MGLNLALITSFLLFLDILLFETLIGTTILLYGWEVLPESLMTSWLHWMGSFGIADAPSLTFYYNLSLLIFFGALGVCISLNLIKRKTFGFLSIILSLFLGIIWLIFPLPMSDSDTYFFALIGLASYLFIGGLYEITLLYCQKCNKVITDKKIINSVTTDTTPDKKDGTNDLRHTPSSETDDTWKYTCTCGHSFTSISTSYHKG